MFNLNSKLKINPEMSLYLKQQTNKWLISLQEKYSNNINSTSANSANSANYYNGIRISDLVKPNYDDNNLPKSYFIYISLFSFLAGYNFYKVINSQ